MRLNQQVCGLFSLSTSPLETYQGDTIGGIGSAIALKRGTFAKGPNGSFKGTLVVQPDRGFNV